MGAQTTKTKKIARTNSIGMLALFIQEQIKTFKSARLTVDSAAAE